jgi:hypothetical protein
MTADALALVNQKSVIGHEHLIKEERRKISILVLSAYTG